MALYDALRKLAYDPSLLLYLRHISCWFMDNIRHNNVQSGERCFSLENEKNPDVFVLTLECSVTYMDRDKDRPNKAERKIKPSFRDAPWNLPPK